MELTCGEEVILAKRTKLNDDYAEYLKVAARCGSSSETKLLATALDNSRRRCLSLSKESAAVQRSETNPFPGPKKTGPHETPRALEDLSIYSTSEDLLNTPIKVEETGSLNFAELSASNNPNVGKGSTVSGDTSRVRRVPDFDEKMNPVAGEAVVMSKEYEEELERQMECLATKNHLSATNVKNIIRAVLTSDDFSKMMRFHLEGKREKPNFELKLTRAKTRQLLGHESVVTWLPTGSGKSSQKSDFEILVCDELLEDSSDEEYNPVEDAAQSDDELKVDEPLADDDTATDDVSEISSCAAQLLEDDDKDNRENIGQRTRSKLSLSETPLEAIAQAFVPPDITTDMYATECDNQDWLNFLKEFDSNVCENNDDENDPEYNVMMDEDHEDVDVEELRADNAVKVSKKELNDLMAELFEYTEMLSSDDEEFPKENYSSENKKDTEKNKATPEKKYNRPTTTTDPLDTRPGILNHSQVSLITEQFIKHVQFLVQSYLIGFGNPFAKAMLIDTIYKMLEELHSVACILEKSGISVRNLEGAWQLAEKWKCFCTDPKETLEDLSAWYTKQSKEAFSKNRKSRLHGRPPIHMAITSFGVTSTAFAFPELLPIAAFGPISRRQRDYLSTSEFELLAIGLDIVYSEEHYNLEKRENLVEALQKIHEELLPFHCADWLLKQVLRHKGAGKRNPISYFFQHYKAPPVTHIVEGMRDKPKQLHQFPTNNMPVPWSTRVIDYKAEARGTPISDVLPL